MITTKKLQPFLPIGKSLKVIGLVGATIGLLGTLLAALAYLPSHPDFSLLNTYLSDIGDTAGWPQVLFNSTTLIMAPVRYLIIVLVVLSLSRIGAGNKFTKTVLVLGAFSTIGTVMMTAVPYSVSNVVHMAGIPLYFFGLVIWQSMVGVQEWKLNLPRVLPILSFSLVISFLVFFVLVMLYEAGIVGRTVAPIWQWVGFFISIMWVYAHCVLIPGVEDIRNGKMMRLN